MKKKLLFSTLLASMLLIGCNSTTSSIQSKSSSVSSSSETSAPASSSDAPSSSEPTSSSESSSESTSTSSESQEGFSVNFTTDEHTKVKVYTDKTFGTLDQDTSYKTRDGDSGEYSNDPEVAQINFVVEVDDGYSVDVVSVTSGTYNKIKQPSDTGVTNGYRITKVSSNIEINVTSRADKEEATGFNATFVIDENSKDLITLTVYKTKSFDEVDTDEHYQTRNGDTGEYCKDGNNSQLNFKVEVPAGYQVTVSATPDTYKNIKDPLELEIENCYRITKITADIEVCIDIALV